METKYLAALAAILLSGCQTQQPQNTGPLTSASDDASRIRNIQQQLYLDNALNQKATRPPGSFAANSDRLSLNWEGDAIELLAQLARQRGLSFAYSGVRLPLPVNLHVNGVTYQNLLRMIEVQTAWRATLHEFPGQLTLAFSQPEKPRGRR